jgi:hypothetical protein
VPLGAKAEAALRARQGSIVFGVDHAAYRAEAALTHALLSSLRADFEG